MELRRALLLFAIVLGVAAVVAAVAGPSSRRSEPTTSAPPAARDAPRRRAARPPVRIRIDGRGAEIKRTIEVGRAATVVVAVDEPGQVELEGLGLTEAAEPTDPAIFDTLPAQRGRYRVLFTPAGGVRARALAELVSRPAN